MFLIVFLLRQMIKLPLKQLKRSKNIMLVLNVQQLHQMKQELRVNII
jgi:hypothetical protein